MPLPWWPVEIKPTAEKPLRIGVIWHDGLVMPHSPIQRVLREFVEKIGQTRHVHVVHFEPYKHDEAWAIISSLYFTDGGKADAAAIEESGEPWLPLTDWIIRQNPCVKNLSREELEYWLEEREEYRSEYNRHWNETGTWNKSRGKWEGAIDALICPVAPWVAPKHNTAKYWPYTAVWNLLDYPALAFPAGKVNKDMDPDHRGGSLSEKDEEMWASCKLSCSERNETKSARRCKYLGWYACRLADRW